MRLVVGVCVVVLLQAGLGAYGQQPTRVLIEVRTESGPVAGADVVVEGVTYRTDDKGMIGSVPCRRKIRIDVVRQGFVPATTVQDLRPGQQHSVVIELQRQPTVEEEVAVIATTRTGARLEDSPMRVEVPGVFLPDDVKIASWFSISASARLDHHSEYGTFFSPRLAALLRPGSWNGRVSVGSGFSGRPR